MDWLKTGRLSFWIWFVICLGLPTAGLIFNAPSLFFHIRLLDRLTAAVAPQLSHLAAAYGGWAEFSLTAAYFAVSWAMIFLIVRGWKHSSRAFHWCLIGYVALCVTCYYGLQGYRNRIDWTQRGLNPGRPGFSPEVLVLSGEFTYWINDQLIHQVKSGRARFEVRSRGFDYYYCERWRGREWKVGSWYNIELAMPGYLGTRRLGKLGHTTRGGGSSTELDPPEYIRLGRHLWSTNNHFIGASAEKQTVSGRYGQQEQYFDLERHGPYLIPRKIILGDVDRREVYTVRKIEFWHTPSSDWYAQIKRKYFVQDTNWIGIDLGEPGVRNRNKTPRR